MACGSGACAAVAIGQIQGKLGKDVRVDLPGGSLRIRWPGPDNVLKMTGPAEHVRRTYKSMSELSGQSNATQLIEPFNDTTELSSADVRAFLLQNPEFFAEHRPLEKIKLPHEQKGSISLVEIQSDQLRKKVRQLNFKLNQLVSIAKQNEKIYRVYTDLNVQLLRCESVAEVQFTLEDVLQERLQLSSAVIKSF